MSKSKQSGITLKAEKRQAISDATRDAIVTHLVQLRAEGYGADKYVSPFLNLSGQLSGSSNKPYRGMNQLRLAMSSAAAGHSGQRWYTLGHVFKNNADLEKRPPVAAMLLKKGSKAMPVVFSEPKTYSKENEHGEDETKSYWRTFYFNVYNESQYKPELVFFPETETATSDNDPLAHADTFFANVNATVEVSHGEACYIPSRNIIRMTPLDECRSTADYYATLAHEHVHWTGGKDQLGRLNKSPLVNRKAYAFEELVAELGAAFVMNVLDIHGTHANHACYIDSWIKLLSDEGKALDQAARYANSAVNYLHRLQPDTVEVIAA
jgi:antirestriction protein ArdC